LLFQDKSTHPANTHPANTHPAKLSITAAFIGSGSGRQRDLKFDPTRGACRAPGTTRMRQSFFIKEIYFAVSEIRPLSVLVRSL